MFMHQFSSLESTIKVLICSIILTYTECRYRFHFCVPQMLKLSILNVGLKEHLKIISNVPTYVVVVSSFYVEIGKSSEVQKLKLSYV